VRTLAALSAILCLSLPALHATQNTTQKKTARSGTPKSASARAPKKNSGKAAAPRTAAARKVATKKTAKRKTAPGRAKQQTWRTRQLTPTPERYREIQQALIGKGYLQGAPSGVWGPDCVQALKKFQQDQNLPADGKLDSLTLISLGLGPRREPLGSTAVIKSPPGAEAREPQ
jgi:peptidoglycan hydrolase-like protein with peptidoglycan-binding domain